jgi:hypothetical protein
LTILRAFCAAGRPDQKLKPWGSFDGWSNLIRNAVVWSGLPDPGEGRKELRSKSDHEAGALGGLYAGIEYLDGNKTGVTSSKILELIESPQHRDTSQVEALREAILTLCPAKGKDLPSPRSLGMKLHHVENRVVGGRSLRSHDRDHVKVWSIKPVGGE